MEFAKIYPTMKQVEDASPTKIRDLFLFLPRPGFAGEGNPLDESRVEQETKILDRIAEIYNRLHRSGKPSHFEVANHQWLSVREISLEDKIDALAAALQDQAGRGVWQYNAPATDGTVLDGTSNGIHITFR